MQATLTEVAPGSASKDDCQGELPPPALRFTISLRCVLRGNDLVRAGLLAALVAVLISAAVNIATNLFPESWRQYEWLAIPLLIVLIAASVILESRSVSDHTRNDTKLDDAKRDLARAVATRWTNDAAHRSLLPPGPMVVGWAIAHPEIAAHASVLNRSLRAIRTGDSSRAHRIPRAGINTEFLDLYLRSPARQLVILGSPGAGKTAAALLIVGRLLRHLAPDEPVPVMVTLSDWDPITIHLWDWLATTLRRDYPALTHRAKYGRGAPERLIIHHSVFGVFDGLDEMPPYRHAAAIDSIRQAISDGHPFILTCRTHEYQAAIATLGMVLPTALVVELLPVTTSDALNYLRENSRPGDTRWEDLFAYISSNPGSPAARALSTPLMIWLAETVYGGPAHSPTELIDAERFPTRDMVEDHLLEHYLPAVYTDTPAASVRRGRLFSREESTRWLRYLAEHLSRRRTRDLIWWKLSSELPARARLALGSGVCLLFGLIEASILRRNASPGFILLVAAIMCSPVSIAVSVARFSSHPVHLNSHLLADPIQALRRASVGVALGVIGAVAAGPTLGPAAALSVMGLGLLLGVVFAMLSPPDLLKATSPQEVLRDDVKACAATAGFGILIGGLAGAVASRAETKIATWLVGCVIGVLVGIFAGGHVARSPDESQKSLLALSKRSTVGATGGAVLIGSIGAIAGLLMKGTITMTGSLVISGAVLGLFFGLMGALAWNTSLWFGVVLLALSSQRKLPLRLTTFLEDARRRGVLRQVGSVYQFRHARLQDSLTRARQADNDG